MKTCGLRMMWLSAWVLCFFSVASTVVAQDQQEAYSEATLMGLPDEELERICVTRGFELVKNDPTTGEPNQISHEDYVKAAQQCLAMEEELNELLREYPELAAELQEELSRLEAEQSGHREEVEELQQQLTEMSEDSSTGNKEGAVGAAFVANPDGKGGEEGVSRKADSSKGQGTNDRQRANKESGKSLEQVNQGSSEDFTLKAIGLESLHGLLRDVTKNVRRLAKLVITVLKPVVGLLRKALTTLRNRYMTEAAGQ